MIVNPGRTASNEGDVSPEFEKWRSVFSQQHKALIEEGLIYAIEDSTRTPIRY